MKDRETYKTIGEQTLNALMEVTHESLVLLDRDGTILLSNTVAAQRLGKTPSEIIGTCLWDYFSPDVAIQRKEKFDTVILTGRPIHCEDVRAGRFFEMYYYPVINEGGKISGVAIFAHDITDRKQADEILQKSEEKYRSIFDNAVEGIFQTAPGGMFLRANPSLARMFGYDSPEDLVKGITDLSTQGYANPEDRVLFKKIIEEKGTIEGFETQHRRKDGSTLWILINARAVKDETGKALYYEGTIEDISLRKIAEEKLKQTLERLRKSLAGTIQVISLIVETRDPYTAGHQRRVSNLARAIASEMGQPGDTVDNIRMAGIIHDIGKISIPAELLAKPTRLTDIEMSLIKVHPQSGYDILKDVDLPYPIAEIVLQHHERLDGSGYPQGLKGDQILLEAKILSVADVTEAIATHRPYRQALGIYTALAEIEKNKGILYDEEAAETCLKLFREEKFMFD